MILETDIFFMRSHNLIETTQGGRGSEPKGPQKNIVERVD